MRNALHPTPTMLVTLLAALLTLFGAACHAGTTWDYASDFSTTQNPSGQWQYGRIAGVGGAFSLYTYKFYGSVPADNSVVEWRGDSSQSTWSYVMAGKNVSAAPVTGYYSTGHLEVGMALLHPCANDELSTARWTAVSAGIVRISARFTGQCFYDGDILGDGVVRHGTTTDVHVAKNGVGLFDGSVMGFAGRAANNYADAFGASPVQEYTGVTVAAPGDIIDFCVGSGGNQYYCDLTGVSASVSVPDDIGLVKGTVRSALAGSAVLPSAIIRTTDGSASATTTVDGTYSLVVPIGTRTLEAVYTGLGTVRAQVTVAGGSTVVQDFSMAPDYGPVYFVSPTGDDSAGGRTPSTAWRTIGNGDAKGLLAAGDTVLVAEGTYPQSDYQGVQLANCSGNAGSPIIYKALGQILIDQTSIPKPTSTSYGFRVSASHIRIEGFEITGSQWGICLDTGSHDNTVANCTIHGLIPGDVNATDERAWCGGVLVSSSSDNLIHHNLIYGTGAPGGSTAGCVMTTGSSQDNRIYNNTLANSWSGVHAWSNAGVVGAQDVRNNIIFGMWNHGIDNGQSTGCTGSHNLFHGNALNYGENASPGNGDILADPLFATDGSYHLQSTSSAIDAAEDVGFACFDSNPDIGAFEYMPAIAGKIGYLKTLPDGTVVEMTDAKAVTAGTLAFVDRNFYVEEPDRASGVRVVPGAGVAPTSLGDRITLRGTMGTGANGERIIEATSVDSQAPGTEIKPLGITGKAISAVSGLNPSGLLVRVCGWVTCLATDGSYAYIDDGSGAADGSGNIGVRIQLSGLALPLTISPAKDQFIAVTGLLGMFMDGSATGPVLRPRSDTDMAIVPGALDDKSKRRRWVRDNLEETATAVPFSFTYNDQPSSEIVGSWDRDGETRQIDSQRTERTVTYTDPATGLRVKCVSVEYMDYPTVEWTVYLKNTGSSDTPIVENLQGLDADLTIGSTGDTKLHHNKGSYGSAQQDDYQPLTATLAAGVPKQLAVTGGRPCEQYLPYFNLCRTDGGVIVAVGWPGQWAAQFTRGTGNETRVTAGQELTHFSLHPGEEVRTPLMVLQFHDGDRVRSQNVWRRWMLDYNVPRPGGQLPAPRFSPLTHIAYWGISSTTDELYWMNRYLSAGIQPDVWWVDAGWYQCSNNWWNTGTWEVDATRHPSGLTAVFGPAHSNGMRSILWFEPERVAPGTWLALNHPEWLLGSASSDRLLDLGNPDAWNWLVNHVDALMTAQGVDDYRQDFNMGPIGYWRGNDAADRQGITEIKHNMGYLAFWDELQARRPNMLIDTCASGGRRNDLETLRRAVPLWRSDYRSEPVGTQGQTYGISSWYPYSGVGAETIDTYTFRSNMTLSINACYDMRNTSLNLTLLHTLVDQWRSVSANYYGDYYPLTSYSLAANVWMAWQFDRPEVGQGMVQAFRRSSSASSSINLKLQGLDPSASYTLINLDGGTQVRTGQYLMNTGLTVTLSSAPGAAVIRYSK